MTDNQARRLGSCLMEMEAPHPIDGDGWQMEFRFGEVWVSVACTSFTDGVEMWAKGLWLEPKKRLTAVEVWHELVHLMESVR